MPGCQRTVIVENWEGFITSKKRKYLLIYAGVAGKMDVKKISQGEMNYSQCT